MIDLFRELEDSLFRPEIRRSADAVGKLLAADFVEFAASGAIHRRQDILDDLAEEAPMERSLTDFAVRTLSDGVVQVTYRSVRRDLATGQKRYSLRSSLWALSDGSWRMIFHQGTVTRPAA